MKIMLLVLPLVYISANAYLYWKTLQALNGIPFTFKAIISVLFWICAFAIFISAALGKTDSPAILIRSLYLAGSIWMAYLLYSVLLLLAFDLVKLLSPMSGHGLKYVFPAVCCLLVYGYVNYRNPKIEKIDIVLDKSVGDKDIKAVAVSDIHLGYATGPKALERYVELIDSQDPDVIFICGDLIDNSLKPLSDPRFAEGLRRLEAPMGIYMVAGNHEYISGIDECCSYLENNTDIILLRDSIAVLPGGIQIAGRDDRANRNRLTLDVLLKETDDDRPVIILDHQPYELREADSMCADIQISGHTHRGQMWPLSILVDRMYEQSHGYRRWKNSHVFVSSGLSLWGPPFRIGTDSDMAVLTISSSVSD